MATILGNPLVIGTTSARLKYSFTGTYQEREDGTIEFLSSGTFRLYKAMEVDLWGIGAGGAGGTGDGGTTSFADILTATGGTAGNGSKGRTAVGKGTSGNGGYGSTPYTAGTNVAAKPGNQNDECREFNSVTGTLRGGGGGGVYSPKGLQGKGGSGLLLIRPTQF